jgi:hypothetical protein
VARDRVKLAATGTRSGCRNLWRTACRGPAPGVRFAGTEVPRHHRKSPVRAGL